LNEVVQIAKGRRESPTVSVIIPAHNYARYLSYAIESVRAQTWDDWECIVVDDGSTDETPELLARLTIEAPRLVVVSQSQQGLSAARNAGLRKARGEFIQFLDADDLLLPTKLATHVQALQSDLDVDIVYGPTRYFDDAHPEVSRTSFRGPEGPEPPPLPGRGNAVIERFLAGNQMTVVAPLVRRSIFDAVGSFDERLRRMEDWDLWLRCAIAGYRFEFIPAPGPVALVRVHAASLSHDEIPMRLAEIQVRARLDHGLLEISQRALNRRRLAEIRAETGRRIGFERDLGDGLRLLVSALLTRPRARWLAWTAALVVMLLPGGRRLVTTIQGLRRRAGSRT